MSFPLVFICIANMFVNQEHHRLWRTLSGLMTNVKHKLLVLVLKKNVNKKELIIWICTLWLPVSFVAVQHQAGTCRRMFRTPPPTPLTIVMVIHSYHCERGAPAAKNGGMWSVASQYLSCTRKCRYPHLILYSQPDGSGFPPKHRLIDLFVNWRFPYGQCFKENGT